MATITGTSLDDVLATTGVVDSVSASSGNDIILIGSAAAHPLGEVITGSSGFDRIWFTSTTGGETLQLRVGVTGVEAVLLANAGGTSGATSLNIDAALVATGLLLVGNDGANTITGSKSHDVIDGNGGLDVLSGGLGNDRIIVRLDEGALDSADGGLAAEGNTLALAGVAAGTVVVDLSLGANADQLLSINAVNEAVVQSDFSHLDASELRGAGVQVTASALANTIIGSRADDLFLYSAAAHLGSSDVLNGGMGNDTLGFTSTTAGQTLTLNARVTGIETVEVAGSTALNVNAASAREALSIVGNDGVNKITGTAKDDSITGNAGTDSLSGGAGNDRFIFEEGAESAALETISGGSGDADFIVFTSATADDTLIVGAKVSGIEGIYLSEDPTEETLDLSGTTALHVIASTATAGLLFKGNDGANSLTGGLGKDTFEGGGGIDTIVAGAGADVVTLDAGELDRADAGAASEGNTLRLTGSAAGLLDVDLTVAADLDQMDGDAEVQADFTHVDASELEGDGVRVTGSSRTNKLTGSDQNDVFLFSRQVDLEFTNSSGTKISDLVNGGEQLADTDGDIVRFTAGAVSSSLRTLSLTASVTGIEKVEIADADGLTTATNTLHVSASRVKSKISIEGNDGANKLTGTAFEDTLNGNAGVDTLLGGAGNDIYEIDSAADVVAGDTITDSAGLEDIVRFTSSTDLEVVILRSTTSGVEKFEVGEDAGDVGINGAAITYGARYLGNEGDNTLIGGARNDTLEGGLGNDVINGGAGADRIVVNMDDGGHGAINAGALTELNWLAFAVEDADEVFGVFVDVSQNVDQILTSDGAQTGFRHVDASGLTHADDPEATEIVISIFGGSEANRFIGSAGDDIFMPGLGNDTVEGGAGSDDIWVNSQQEYNGDFYSDSGGTRDDYIVFTATSGTLKLTNNFIGVDAASCGGTANINLDASAVSQPFGLQGNTGNNHLKSTIHGESLFEVGGIDTMEGGGGDDDYTMLGDGVWTFVDDGINGSNEDRIIDTGGVDHFYHTGSGLLVVGNRGTNSIEIFAVSGDDIKPSGVFRRDIEEENDGGLDVHHVTHAITLGGSFGNNVLIATSFNDTIIGHKGQDTIVGLAGTDQITMDVSDGTVYQIEAGAESENNLLFITGEAEETIRFDLSQSLDQITHIGAAAEGQVQSGLRHINATAMAGDKGIIVLNGGSAANKLTGSNQDDVLEGAAGKDVVLGGGGNDAIVIRNPSHMVTGEIADAGAGDGDALWFAWSAGSITLTVNPLALRGFEVIAVADDTGATTGVTALNINASAYTTALKLIGNDGANKLTGTARNDTLIGNDGADSLSGGTGNDVFIYEAAAESTGDTVSGSSGTDTVRFASETGGEVLVLGAGVTSIEVVQIASASGDTAGTDALGVDASALAGRMLMQGNEGDNTIIGGAGNDTILGNGGNDTIDAGGGADRIGMGIESATIDSIDAGARSEGNTLVVSGLAAGPMVWDLSSDTDQLVSIDAVADAGTQVGITHLELGQIEFADVNEVEGATITGSSEVNRIIGTLLDDTFIVKAAADHGAGETISGGAGNDEIIFDSPTAGETLVLTTKVTGIESVVLQGTANLNLNAAAITNGLTIEGNSGNNIITSTARDDVINAGAGADTITAGAGRDKVKTDLTAEDAVHGGALSEQNEWVLEGTAGSGLVFNLASTGDQLLGGGGTLMQRGFTHLDARAVTGNGISVIGSSAANRIAGTTLQDTIAGGAGADTITMDAAADDLIDGGLLTEGNELVLIGAAGALFTVDLSSAGDQIAGGVAQTDFMHFDASAMTGNAVNVTGSSAANRIAGTAQQDVINAGAGADIVSMDVSSSFDQIDAGAGNEGDTLRLTGEATAVLTLNLGVATGADQLILVGAGAEALVQSDFQHVDASKLLAFGVDLRGSGANNVLTGSAGADTIAGFAGADRIDLGVDAKGNADGVADHLIYRSVADGVGVSGVSASRDLILHFEGGRDQVKLGGELNGGKASLDDIDENDAFKFAQDERADFAADDEALFISMAKAKVSNGGLYVESFSFVLSAINRVGVTAAAGDDGLIVVQSKTQTGVYYYKELAGTGVQSGELTLLGVIDSHANSGDFGFIA